MAWGYEKCFTIEHDPTVKKKIDCKDCIYYEASDKSCGKRPLYLPEDGYNSWKNCNYFELDSSTSNYDAKLSQLKSMHKYPHKVDDFVLKKPNVIKKNAETNAEFKVLSKIGKYVVIVPTNSIHIPNKFKSKVPGKKKIDEVEQFYATHKELDKPVLISKSDGKYSVVDGYTRLYVAKKIGLECVPVLINDDVGKKRVKLCKKNLEIKHDSYGKGIVLSFDLRNIEIKFQSKAVVTKLSLDFCAEKKTVSFIQ